jgi:LemA protein
MTLVFYFYDAIVVLVVVTGVALFASIIYNELLKQRHDEIPNLVEAVKGYMHYEKETLLAVTEARAAAVRATTVGEKALADLLLTGALRSFFGVAENYPQLKANENFLKLQGRISELEERIADRREYFNNDVNTYNTRIRQVPEVFFARLFRMRPRELFQVSDADRRAIEVKFEENVAGDVNG